MGGDRGPRRISRWCLEIKMLLGHCWIWMQTFLSELKGKRMKKIWKLVSRRIGGVQLLWHKRKGEEGKYIWEIVIRLTSSWSHQHHYSLWSPLWSSYNHHNHHIDYQAKWRTGSCSGYPEQPCWCWWQLQLQVSLMINIWWWWWRSWWRHWPHWPHWWWQ